MLYYLMPCRDGSSMKEWISIMTVFKQVSCVLARTHTISLTKYCKVRLVQAQISNNENA